MVRNSVTCGIEKAEAVMAAKSLAAGPPDRDRSSARSRGCQATAPAALAALPGHSPRGGGRRVPSATRDLSARRGRRRRPRG